MKPAGSYRKLLIQPSFIYYLITQFITAFNDNAFKIVVMLLALQTPDTGYVDIYYISAQLVFTLPFFMFSGYAGYLADLHPKNKVIVATKILEVFIMLMAVYFLGQENKLMLIGVLFFLSTQSVFLSPAKYGILPEWFNEEEISRANGIVELITFLAIILGSAIGGILMQFLGGQLYLIGIILLFLAGIGLATSFGMSDVEYSGAKRDLKVSPWHEIIEGIKVMSQNKLLATTIGGISFFFAMGLAVTTNLMVFGKEIFDLTELQLGLLNASMGLGIGLGSIAAGWLSGDKIEYGLIPLGAFGLTACVFAVSFTYSSIYMLYVLLALTGFFAGLFIVPLNALLQELPGKHEKGRLIATNNFFNGAAMVLAVLLIWFLQATFHLTSDSIMYVLAWITLIFSIITLSFNPRFFFRFVIWILIHIFYKVEVVGSPNIPKKGPALIVSNHVSYIDGLILSTVFPRFIRYLAHRYYYDHPLLNPLMRFAYAIPIESGSESKVKASIKSARQELLDGHVVCIFAEGRLTRTGNLLPFKSGLEQIVQGLDVPIIPVHLDQLWDSIFSPRRDKQFFRLPQQFPARITVTLGDPMISDSKSWQVRQAVQELAVEARVSGYQREHFLSVEFFKSATAYPYRYCIFDQKNNKAYRYAAFSSKVLLIANKLKKIHDHEERVGVLLPCSFQAVLMNTALNVAGKSVVNIPLDYSYDDITQLKKLLGIRSIYTSRYTVGERLISEFNATDIELVLKKINGSLNSLKWRMIGLFKYLLPVKLMVKFIGSLPDSPEAEVAVLVPSAESRSKNTGDSEVNNFVTISHESVYNNISGVKQILQFNGYDRFANLLPLNNAFSFTSSMWTPFILGSGQVPIDLTSNYEKHAEIIYKQQATVLIINEELLKHYLSSTAINLLSYIRFAICFDNVDDFLLEEFFDKFGIRIMTGLGFAEVGSFASLNTPNIRQKGMLQRGFKRGSVGHPLPNVALRIMDLNNEEICKPGVVGILEIKTPAYMLGYAMTEASKGKEASLNNSIVGNWHKTNMTAYIDDEGFLFVN